MKKIQFVACCCLSLIVVGLPLWALLQSNASARRALPVGMRTSVTRLESGPLRATLLFSEPESHSSFDRPRITNVQIVKQDVVFCDAVQHAVGRIRFGEPPAVANLLDGENSVAAPCHTAFTDIDADGDEDVVVASLGNVWPQDSRCGSVVLLRKNDSGYEAETIVSHLRRIADVQPADFDQDGDVDLVVAEFGYLHGGILYLEQQDDGSWRRQALLEVAGAIHTPVRDFDGDGDLDFAVLVSQDQEKVLLFENTGESVFQPKVTEVWSTINFDLGTAGMIASDLDQDGDSDLILTAGDNLEFQFPYPQPWHGCLWLENKGGNRFAMKRLADFPGTYAADVADLDADGDLDIVVVSMFNDWKQSGATSLGWLENDGQQNFAAWHLADSPTHLCTVSCGDLDGDGRPEIATGSLQAYPPFRPGQAGLAVWKIQPEAIP